MQTIGINKIIPKHENCFSFIIFPETVRNNKINFEDVSNGNIDFCYKLKNIFYISILLNINKYV